MQILFATATIADINQLHKLIHDLQQSQTEMAHSLNQKVTYLKHLDATTTLHKDAIVNLTSTLKDTVYKSQVYYG